MRIAAAQIIVFLSLLFQLFALELSIVVFHCLGIFLQPVMTVAHVENEVLVELKRLAFIPKSLSQFFFLLLEGLEGFLELSLLVES